MRKLLFVALLLLCCGTFAVAQESKGEFSAGWSFLHLDCGSGCPVSNAPAGFDLGGTYYFARMIGLAADFDYHHKDITDAFAGTLPAGDSASARTLGLHFGPRVKVRMGKVEPFGHALFGFTHLTGQLDDPSLAACGSSTCSVSDNAFSTKLGGGLDVSVSRHLGLRLGEFNYYLTKFDQIQGISTGQGHQNNFTYSAGILIR